MAVLYITEYAELSILAAGRVGQMPVEPPVVPGQTVAINVGSTQSAAFNAATKFIRVETDAICAIEIGVNPTALVASGGAGSQRLAANQTQFHDVSRGSFKLAVIQAS